MSVQAGDLFAVRGLVAVITGGGTGIGLMIAKALALNGASKVYIIGRRREKLEEAAKESPHGNIIPITGDVTSKESLQAAAKQVEQECGYINLLVANSGVLGPQSSQIKPDTSLADYQATMWAMDFQEYSNTFAVNTGAVWFTVMAFLGLLDAGNRRANVPQSSQIVATSSIAGFNRQAPGGFAYGQSKAAVTHQMKQLATSLVPYSIRANVIAPGLYPSDMAAPMIGKGKFTKDRIPAERTGSVEDMAGAILYLASRAGAYCNGNVIVTDGGRVSVTPSTY